MLKKRPDGKDTVLSSYARGALRLYASLYDLSQAEVEWLFSRLSHSAKTFRFDATTRNYWLNALKPLLDDALG